MGSRIFMTLFALPFLGVGIWATYSIISSFIEAEAMKSWVPVQAQVLKGGVDENTDSDGSTTYKAYAEYKYNYQGQDYTASRVAIDTTADNIGHAHEEQGAALASAANEGRSIEVYVDPAAPYSAVVYRDLRWGMVGFKALFAVLFGGAGIGLIASAFYRKRGVDRARGAAFPDAPWLANPDWQSPEIKPGSKTAMQFTWGFAVVWNLISSPIWFVLPEEVGEKQNYAALIALLFPLVGVGLLYWAIRQTLEWRKFGPSPVVLDPFPAAIGGQAGGTIELPVPFDSAHVFNITLAAIHSFESGSGKNRSRRERVAWQQSVVAYAEPGMDGTRLQFRFDIPEGLPPSDADQDGAYHLWRLSVQADLPGVDVDRHYEIPAYPATTKSRIGDRAAQASSAATKTKAEGDARNRIIMRGDDMFYPMGRNALSCLIGILVGGLFAGIGVFLFAKKDAWFIGAIFGGLGALLFTGCVYAIANSLTVRRDSMGSGIETVRRLFGIPIKSHYAAIDDIASLHSDSSSAGQRGGRQVKFYRIYGKLKQGGDITLGESFEGEAEAEAAITFIREKLGIRS